jgi:dienelactone hydrolase
MQTKKIEYQHNGTHLEGYLAYDDAKPVRKPLVIIAHDWTGCNEFAHKKAEKLAELGYIGFALDVFGKGKLGKNNEEKMQLIKPFLDDRNLLLQRIIAGLETAKKQEMVDDKNIAAIGFCFGGLCVLDLARSGAEIKGVVSFHGLLNPPPTKDKTIHAKILALHGYDDPMVPPENIITFGNEMTQAKADWQLHIYGNTKHAFTNPVANDHGIGTVYNSLADQRSWIQMKDFFIEIFK